MVGLRNNETGEVVSFPLSQAEKMLIVSNSKRLKKAPWSLPEDSGYKFENDALSKVKVRKKKQPIEE